MRFLEARRERKQEEAAKFRAKVGSAYEIAKAIPGIADGIRVYGILAQDARADSPSASLPPLGQTFRVLEDIQREERTAGSRRSVSKMPDFDRINKVLEINGRPPRKPSK